MKTKKLLHKLQAYLDAEQRELQDKRKSIKKVLKNLKQKRNVLREQLAAEDDAQKREQLEKQIDVLKAQRKKGMRLLKDLKKPAAD